MALLMAAYLVLCFVAGFSISKLWSFCRRLQHDLDNPIEVVLEDPTSLKPALLPSIFSPPTKQLSVIVPAYNEQDRLPNTLAETLTYLQRRRDRQGPSFTYEIIVVDDGSSDDTSKEALKLVDKHGFDTLRLLRVTANRGKGHAVKRGMLIARGQRCLLMDADGATRFSDLEKLEAALASNSVASYRGGEKEADSGALPADPAGPLGMAVGSRSHLERSAAAKRHFLRNFLTRGFHLLVMCVAGSAIRDTQCGFKLFSRRAAAVVFSNQRLQRWCFDVELICLAQVLGIPISEVHVHWTEMPGSKIRFTSILHMAWELLTLKVAYQWLGTWPVASEAQLARKAQ